METTILVIPSEGNSPDTEQWYIKSSKERYGKELNVIVFGAQSKPLTSVRESTNLSIISYVVTVKAGRQLLSES